MFCDDLSPRLKRAIPDRPIRVLVVDDQVDVAEALARLLRALGCAATSITEPAKALNTALGIEADIVFMDICMPGLDGYDLARMFREHFGEIVYLVAVTAEAGEMHRKKSSEAGFDALLSKPVDIQMIESLLATVLSSGRQKRGVF